MKKMIVLASFGLIALGLAINWYQKPADQRAFAKNCERDLAASDKGASLRQISKVFKVTDCRKIFALVESKRSLDLGSVVEVESLRDFINLQSLSLDLFSEVDLSALHNMRQLKTLKITANFGRVSAHGLKALVGHLPQLETLSLANIDLPAADEGFADKSPLKKLELADVGIRSFDSIGHLPEVKRLAIPFSAILNLNGIETYKNLQELVISGTRVEELEPLSQLSQLTFLDLSMTAVKDLKPLASLPKLQRILFDRNQAMHGGPLAPLECPTENLSQALKDVCSRS